jgi:NTP pyrophosphatase (non-canonical NTP hydrolase)
VAYIPPEVAEHIARRNPDQLSASGVRALLTIIDDLRRRDPANMLDEFHNRLNQPFGANRGSVDTRRKLHTDEHNELMEALEGGDPAQIAKELADEVYVDFGTAHNWGIPLIEVLLAVHVANMSKQTLPGAHTLDGKVMKPPGFVEADVAGILHQHATRLAYR